MIRLASVRLPFLVAVFLLVSVGVPVSSSAPGAVDWSTRFRCVADDRQFTDYADAMVFAGDLAYFATWGGFEIWDLSVPVQPVRRGSVALGPGVPTCVAASAGLAVVGGDHYSYEFVTILDVSDPDVPAILSEFEVDHPIVDAEIINDFLYLVPDDVGLDVWHISDPSAPVSVGSLRPGQAVRSIDALGTTAYVATIRRIYAYDFSTPEVPVVHSWVAHPDPRGLFRFLTVAVGDDPARVVATSHYDVSGNYDEVRISAFDMTPPGTGFETGAVTECAGVPGPVGVDGDRAFVGFSTFDSQVTSREAGILVVDFSPPGGARTIAAAGVEPGEARGIGVLGDEVVLVEAGAQPGPALQVFDASTPEGVPATGATEGRAKALLASADRLFVVVGYQLRIHDALAPGLPLLGTLPLGAPLWGRALAREGDVIVSGAYDGVVGGRVETFDVSDPASGHLLGSAEVSGYPYEIATQDGIAYVASYAECCCDKDGTNCWSAGGLYAVDVSTPAAPALLGGVDRTFEFWHALAPSGARLYASCQGGLRVFDISIPGTFTLVGEVLGGGQAGGNCLAVRGDMLFGAIDDHPDALAEGFHTAFVAYSLVDPDHPVEVGYVELPGDAVHGVVLDGDVAYVANGVAGVIAIDAADPANLSVLGHFASGARAIGLAISGGGIHAADGDFLGNTGVPRVWRVSRHAPAPVDAPGLAPPGGLASPLRVRPNPARGSASLAFSLDAGRAVRLEVLDVRGRVVRVVSDGWIDAGPHELVWNGRDRANRTAAAGVYFVRLIESDRVTTRKLTLLR